MKKFFSRLKTLNERGNATVSFLASLPIIFILMGFGIDASVHGYYVNHQKDIISTAVRNASAHIETDGHIVPECALGAALKAYAANRDQLAASADKLPKAKSEKDTYGSSGYAYVSSTKTYADDCVRGDYSDDLRVRMGGVAADEKSNFIVSRFEIRQPSTTSDGTNVPGAVMMCTRENHKSFIFGAFIPKFRSWDTEVCATSMNILNKKA